LSEAGIGEDQPLTSKFHDIRLKTWLELALEELELRYLVRDDVVLITSPEYAESRLEVRVYDCRDLLAMPAPLGAEKLLPARPAAGAAMRGGMFSVADDPPGPGVRPSAGGGGFGGLGTSDDSAADPGPRTEHDLRVERLIELITGNIDADSWTDVGGPGSIHEYNGLIVVTQTGQTHDKVERVLDMLRAAADLDGPGKVVR
jgi:general secretion pathway protein D